MTFPAGHCARGIRQPLPESQGAISLPGDITALAGKSSRMYIGCDIVLESEPGVKKCKAASAIAFARRGFCSHLTTPQLCKPFLRRQLLLSGFHNVSLMSSCTETTSAALSRSHETFYSICTILFFYCTEKCTTTLSK